MSAGLLRQLSADEAEAVLGHEVSHVANGDMVTLSLMQGVLNTFVFFFARLVAQMMNRGNNNAFVYFTTVMVFQAVFGVLASIIVMAFSRYREYRADAGGASLAGRAKMIAALQKLQAGHGESQLEGQLTAFGISGKRATAELFMSHPPIEKRIAALQTLTAERLILSTTLPIGSARALFERLHTEKYQKRAIHSARLSRHFSLPLLLAILLLTPVSRIPHPCRAGYPGTRPPHTGLFYHANPEIREDLLQQLQIHNIEYWINSNGSIGFYVRDTKEVDRLANEAIGVYIHSSETQSQFRA